MTTRRVTATLVGTALALSLAACSSHSSTPRPASPTNSASISVERPGGSQTKQVLPAAPPSAPTAATAAAQQSADLATITNDLNGIDSATTQASNDLNAGDNARNQNDNG